MFPSSFSVLICLLIAVYNNVMALSPDEVERFVARTYVEDTIGLQGFVRISNHSTTEFQITANGIPDHVTGPFDLPQDSDDVLEQNFEFYIPKDPVVADSPTDLNMGPIGLAINGVAIFSPYSAQGTDAVITEERTFDECDGHPSPMGTYHYHGSPICVFEDTEGVSPSIVGLALDGFPIYGPTDENGNRLFSVDLDECHGRYVNGEYRYHITDDFPYILGCYKGEVDERNFPQGMGPNRPNQGGLPGPMTNPTDTQTQMTSSEGSNAGNNDPLGDTSGRASKLLAQSMFSIVMSCLAVLLSFSA